MDEVDALDDGHRGGSGRSRSAAARTRSRRRTRFRRSRSFDPETLDFEMNVDWLLRPPAASAARRSCRSSLAKMAQMTLRLLPRQVLLRHRRHLGLLARAQLLPPRVRHGAGVHGRDAGPRDRPERDQDAPRQGMAEFLEKNADKRRPLAGGLPRPAPRSRRRAVADPPAGRRRSTTAGTRREGYAAPEVTLAPAGVVEKK